MEQTYILSKVDHTLLSPAATWAQIKKLCDDAVEFHTASVCIPPTFVKQAAEYLRGRLAVCTVIGFPTGYHTTAVKVLEAREAVKNGAQELDMVINLGWVKEGQYGRIKEEIQAVKEACGERVLKIIIETCLLTEDEKIALCKVVSETDADYIKTSTGFSTNGAMPEDVALLRKYTADEKKVKAAGGISSFADAEKFIELGADRLGTSRLVREAKGSISV